MGINTLKPRLSRVLREHILIELPGLIRDVCDEIGDCESRLERLGVSRANKQEQMLFLHKVSHELSTYVQSSVHGNYNDRIFQDMNGESAYNKRIRAVVFNLLDQFTDEMRKKGRQYRIVEEINQSSKTTPIPVTRDQRLQQVGDLIKKHRGLELPGFQKYGNITMLFRQQCAPWTRIAHKFADTIFEHTKIAMYAFLAKASDQAIAEGILRFIVNPALDEIETKLGLSVEKNLEQHVRGYPITFNHYFTDNLQKFRSEHEEDMMRTKLENMLRDDNSEHESCLAIEDVIDALNTKTEADMHTFTYSEALHFMEAYYKVALKFFIDDFIVHTIEQELLNALPGIFTPEKVLQLDEATIGVIAGETEESVIERESSSTKLTMLKEALRLLYRLESGFAHMSASKYST